MNASDGELELDCRGQLCPQPVIDLARAMPGVVMGGVVAVCATDPAAAYDIPAWCRMRDQEFLGTSVLADAQVHRVRRRT